ncbi:hypothetical protein SAMN06295912_1343 [Sphingomonas laterariae]|uniref:DUF4239 domain-containing protein n=1 Tax=Edaphosphingomonas laterariae TaxID=861865 RepID=A0A239JEX9_9SPHN|nr:hypothetical protein [Sphingomonas laterariae]SNT04359.1 hypothetical protein SAMN06295912_1343 [Sphingomonas laterariae]
MEALAAWLDDRSIIALGLCLLGAMAIAALFGFALRRWRERQWQRDGEDEEGGQEGYVVSAVLGLLALLLGFTFALAVDRFETRRALVLQEANAIGTSYLRSQLLDEPHRTRLSGILRDYAANRVELASAQRDAIPPLMTRNDAMLEDLWSATAAAYDGLKPAPFANSLLDTVNEVIDLDASRKAARQVRVPAEVFMVLVVYIVVTAGVLGYVLVAVRGFISAGFLFALIIMSLMLIMDIDRPVKGGIQESQGPMIDLLNTIRKQPPGHFDRWRAPPA